MLGCLCVLIDPGFGELGQRFVCLVLFAQRGVQQLGGLTQAEFSRPSLESSVAGHFIMLDCLSGREQPRCP
jgi:hypothetical protein